MTDEVAASGASSTESWSTGAGLRRTATGSATFLSERMDFDNCARFHPVYFNDYSSFCLK